MNCPSKLILSVVLLFEQTLKDAAGTLFCASPQYVILGKRGIVECSFPNQFHTIAWYDSVNTAEALVTKIEKQENGTLEVSGDGYESGAYDIYLNGSLIIPSTTTYHDRTFRVVLIDERRIPSVRDIDLTTIVHPLQTTAAVNLCGADGHCFVNSMETDSLNCTYTGARPAVELTWYNNKGEKMLQVSTAAFSDGNYTFTSISSLDISAFTEKSLTVFTCEASGPALNFKNITKTVFVYNIQTDVESHYANVTEKNVILNSTLIISCTDTRMPTVFVWSFKRTDTPSILLTSADGKAEVADNLNDSFEVSKDGALHFKQVDDSTEGLFTCIYLKDDVSSLNMVRVTIVESKDVQDETGQTFPTTIVVIIVIVLIMTIIGLLCCVSFYLRKQKTSPPPSTLGMEPATAVDMLDSANNKTESVEEYTSVTSPNGENEFDAEVEMEQTANKGPKPEERSFNSEKGNHPDEAKEPTNISSHSAEEQPNRQEEGRPDKVKDSANSPDSEEESDEEFFDANEDNVDAYNDALNVNPESVKMLSLLSSSTEEKNYETKGSEDNGRDFPEEENDPGIGTAMGAALSNWRLKVDHEDKQVDSIGDLAKGDHIVFSGWTLHPRCHGIVVDTNIERNKIRLVRFTYQKGVVEEWKKWKPPIYKVTRYYIGDKSVSSKLFESDVVIERARSRINNDRLTYNIATNNCKTFARWCKTGATPAGEFGYD